MSQSHKKKSHLSSLALLALGPALHGAQAQTAVALPAVTIGGEAQPDLRERTRRAAVGALGERELVDTPYAVSVVPTELVANQQGKTIADALRYLPWVQADAVRPQARGVQGGVIQNTRIDGFNIVGTTDYPLEQFDRIEVMSGVAGSLYGAANASGNFNYVLKRAEREPLRRIALGTNDSGGRLVHADFGQPLDADGKLRLRANLLDDEGRSWAPNSVLRRQLGSLAVDADIDAATRLELNASRYHYVARGLPGSFAVATGVKFPGPVDPAREGYGQHYAGADNDTRTMSFLLHRELAPDWTLTLGYLRQIADRETSAVTNTVTNATTGAYTTSASTTTASRFTVDSNQLRLNGRAVTGPVTHALTLANSGFDWENFNPVAGRSVTLGSARIGAPMDYAAPVWPNYVARYRSASQQQQAVMAADELGLGDRWKLMLSASWSRMKLRNYSAAGVASAPMSDDGLSPAASLMYKPTADSSVYAGYSDTLQPGDVAPAGSANAGQWLSPYRSKQWEAGWKARAADLDLSATAFRIVRPYAFAAATGAVYATDGEQVNRGIELGATGRASELLSIYSGLTWLDPKLTQSSVAASENKRIVGLSRLAASVAGELRIPAVAGLSLSARVAGAGKRAANNANTDWIGGYVVADAGLRYNARIGGNATVWRLSANNLADTRYWTNVVAGGLNGYSGTGNAAATVAAPRTVIASVQFDL
ncbi:TonB-dependent siderophore receptor [Derxia lacustris]|uniref:TonB-dependent siderophore receptor n=1 Tax=Derxia lacustris TaxID=764842 RepID=UPI000A16FEA9|nr:TonB-dependent siderophore receptor [Derxia lacustris]